jgi:hypothetical protein
MRGFIVFTFIMAVKWRKLKFKGRKSPGPRVGLGAVEKRKILHFRESLIFRTYVHYNKTILLSRALTVNPKAVHRETKINVFPNLV